MGLDQPRQGPEQYQTVVVGATSAEYVAALQQVVSRTADHSRRQPGSQRAAVRPPLPTWGVLPLARCQPGHDRLAQPEMSQCRVGRRRGLRRRTGGADSAAVSRRSARASAGRERARIFSIRGYPQPKNRQYVRFCAADWRRATIRPGETSNSRARLPGLIWAASNQVQVSLGGRIPASVLEGFRAAATGPGSALSILEPSRSELIHSPRTGIRGLLCRSWKATDTGSRGAIREGRRSRSTGAVWYHTGFAGFRHRPNGGGHLAQRGRLRLRRHPRAYAGPDVRAASHEGLGGQGAPTLDQRARLIHPPRRCAVPERVGSGSMCGVATVHLDPS
jgi:hypothetical protein